MWLVFGSVWEFLGLPTMRAFLTRFQLGKDRESKHRSPAQPPDTHRKVAFVSPPQTPVAAILDRELPPPPEPAPAKTSVARFHAEPPRSPPPGPSSCKPDRPASPCIHRDVPSAPSIRSTTPYSTMSAQTSGSRILAAASWSELTEDDLVSNIGSRERTRQEVLFEIISSEERYVLSPAPPSPLMSPSYVQELSKMKETFIDPLLHPFSTSPPLPFPSSPPLGADYDYYRNDSPAAPAESLDDLPPIAARFMSPTPSLGHPSASSSTRKNIDDSDDDDDPARPYLSKPSAVSRQASNHSHPHSPYRSTPTRTSNRVGTTVPFPSRSHQSLPHPRNQAAASTQSLGKQSTIVEAKLSETATHKSGVLGRLRKTQTTPTSLLGDSAIPPRQLPEDLRACLQVIDGGVFDGHRRLSEALKRRYDDQYPLVRSLADVFVSNVSFLSPIFASSHLHLVGHLPRLCHLCIASRKGPRVR